MCQRAKFPNLDVHYLPTRTTLISLSASSYASAAWYSNEHYTILMLARIGLPGADVILADSAPRGIDCCRVTAIKSILTVEC